MTCERNFVILYFVIPLICATLNNYRKNLEILVVNFLSLIERLIQLIVNQ